MSYTLIRHLCTMLLMLWIASAMEAQPVHVITTGQPAMLVAGGFSHGSVQWQSSTDKVTWTNIPGWVTDSVTFPPPVNLTWYRAEIVSGTCSPICSDIQGVRLFQCGEPFTDTRDGRVYPTVQIGNQCWFGSNMNVGTMIYGHLNMLNDSVIEKYCFGNDTNNCNTYGALYQWDEMMQYVTAPGAQGICPQGWHIPTDQDILSLEIFLGMASATANLMNTWRGTDEGTKIKQGGSSGFNANLTGLRYDGGMFYNQGTFEYIYTSNTYSFNTLLALRRCLSSTDPTIGRYNNTSKTVGASVRCLKDN
jgi:uncharacterized protein (TIGR02145 family)